MGRKAVAANGRRTQRVVAQNPRGADRSSYFARREAAKVLRSVLQGDAKRCAPASIKTLVYGPSVKNKRATFALVCQTLKCLPIVKDVLESAGVINSKWKNQKELLYIVAYDHLFGQNSNLYEGDAERYLRSKETALDVALAKLLVKHKLQSVEQLASLYESPDISRPCYVRVNTLKISADDAILKLRTDYTLEMDDLVTDLLVLPPNSDLHNHPLVLNGCVFIQGKGSSMVAAALDPKPASVVLDACAAPGNKTVHLSAIMKGTGRVIACELNKERLKRLEETVKLSGAANIEIVNADFLKLNPTDPKFAEVSCILLDPSCSGSGTTAQRLDHLLPSYSASVDTERLRNLAAFQTKALMHAMAFPGVERIVYSTCSVNQIENEDVIASVSPLAKSLGFHLVAPFPRWRRRGLSGCNDSELFLRMDPVEDKEGFFIAVFAREFGGRMVKTKSRRCFSYTRLSRVLIFAHLAGNFLE